MSHEDERQGHEPDAVDEGREGKEQSEDRGEEVGRRRWRTSDSKSWSQKSPVGVEPEIPEPSPPPLADGNMVPKSFSVQRLKRENSGSPKAGASNQFGGR